MKPPMFALQVGSSILGLPCAIVLWFRMNHCDIWREKAGARELGVILMFYIYQLTVHTVSSKGER